MADRISVESAAEFIAFACEPLTFWDDQEAAAAFVTDCGFVLPSVPSGFSVVAAAAKILTDAAGDLLLARIANSGIPAATAQVVAGVAGVVASIRALPSSLTAAPPNGLPPEYLAETGIADVIERRILDKLLVDRVRAVSQRWSGLLLAVGVIEEETVAVVGGPDTMIVKVRLDRLQSLLTDQGALLQDVYGWGTADIKTDQLFAVIRELGSGLLSGGVVRRPSDAFVAAMFPGASPEEVSPMLEIPLVGLSFPPVSIGAMPAPKANPTDVQAIALLLLGSQDLALTIPAGIVTVTLTSDLSLEAGVGLLLRPHEPPSVIAAVESGGTSPSSGKLTLGVTRAESTFPFVVASLTGGSELRIKSYFTDVTLDLSPSDLTGRAGVQGGELVVSLSDADGFLSDVMPAEGLTARFDLTIGWSKNRGVFLTGSAGLETTLALNLQVGPVTLQTIRLLLQASGAGLELQAGLTAALAIGPVTASVEGIGATALLNFTSGNLGPVDLSMGFLPPTGIGIAVNAGPVSGGGFISFEPDRAVLRGAGAVDLRHLGEGVRADRDEGPGRDKGFSFVIVISAEFTPIQLGFGFTLNGVGGLRRDQPDAERATCWRKRCGKGGLENVLFPNEPDRERADDHPGPGDDVSGAAGRTTCSGRWRSWGGGRRR